MLPNPQTPPNEPSAIASDNDFILPATNVQDHPSPATSISNISLGQHSMEGTLEVEDTPDTHHFSDHDADMSDGGAALSSVGSPMSPIGVPLTISLSHAEQLNAEMDMLDAELMGTDNLQDMFHESHFGDFEPTPYSYADLHQPIQPNPTVFGPNPANMIIVDEVEASALSQQLQHLQDQVGEDHVGFNAPPDLQQGAFIENSTTPFPHTLQLPLLFGNDWGISLSVANATEQQQSVPQFDGPHNPSDQGNAVQLSLADMSLLQSQLPLQTFHFAIPIAADTDNFSDANVNEVEDQLNLSLADFLYNWARSTTTDEEPRRRAILGPSLPEVVSQRDRADIEPMERSDLQGERCDIQRINWKELGVSILEARQMRRKTYKNYTNIRYPLYWHPRMDGARLTNEEDYFKFRRMDFDREVYLSHFQLRNLLACASRDHVFYAGRSKVMHFTPREGNERPSPSSVTMDLANPTVIPIHSFTGGIQISTLTVGHNILVAGGFCGEFGLVNLRADKKSKHTEGIITQHSNSITNHIQVHLSRGSSLPLAAFSSNDNGLRVVDVHTNKFIANHKYDHAINCSAISPDQRLRVLVGDSQKVMICNSETGQVLQELEGHRDYGFACDWADDGWTVATGNQDMQVKIWDARKWKNSSGISSPIQTVAAEMAGVRKLKFSPVGSGKRVLVAAEPADFVSVIDGQTFLSKQTLSFFGEIGGVDFANDGQDLIIANCDGMRGGIMQYERCSFASEALHDWHEERRERRPRQIGVREKGYDWNASDGDVTKHPKSRGTEINRARKSAMLGRNIEPF